MNGFRCGHLHADAVIADKLASAIRELRFDTVDAGTDHHRQLLRQLRAGCEETIQLVDEEEAWSTWTAIAPARDT